jgi:hypothetical protein
MQSQQDKANPPPVVLSLYDLTGKFVQPWARAGYDCYCIDIQHPQGENKVSENVTLVGADMRDWRPARDIVDRVKFLASFSPCDDASVSGARWFKGKGLLAMARSVELFAIGRDWINWLGAPGFCEHPVSTISTYYRKSDYKFHPHDYTGHCLDDNYTKETHIWAYNGFIMPEPNRALMLEAPDDRIHKAAPGPDRKNFRSATPMGFAEAVFLANSGIPCLHPGDRLEITGQTS